MPQGRVALLAAGHVLYFCVFVWLMRFLSLKIVGTKKVLDSEVEVVVGKEVCTLYPVLSMNRILLQCCHWREGPYLCWDLA